MSVLDSRGLENEKVWEAILYSYRIDPDAPSYLSRGDRIFAVNKDEFISISSASGTETSFVYSDSSKTAASKVAASMSVGANYGAFSAAASMAVKSTEKSDIKTVRMDRVTKAQKYKVSAIDSFKLFPARHLTENFKEAVAALTVEEIERNIGSFYAKSMVLGAEVRKSYIMEATSSDTERSVQAELEGAYGGSMMGVKAKASAGVTKRNSNKNADMREEWSAKGGDTMIWLRSSFETDGETTVEEVQEEWANSITDDNLYPFDYELGLVWKLVEAVDQQKGKEYREYLEKKWEENKMKFVPTKFVES